MRTGKQVEARLPADDQALLVRIREPRIPLPSSLPPAVLERPSMKLVVDLGLRERQACAVDVLSQLRGSLITLDKIETVKDDLHNQALLTRARTAEKGRREERNLFAGLYRLSRAAMVVLGMPSDDVAFKPLLATDLRAFLPSGSSVRGSSHKNRDERRQEERRTFVNGGRDGGCRG